MAGRKLTMGNAAVAATALVALLVVAAASGAAAAGYYKVCNVDRDDVVSSCKSYCVVGSTEAKPSDACCAAVKGANIKCLCQFRNMLSPDIDGNRAMQIPSQCANTKGAPNPCSY